jgi:hypothetical protein
VARHRKRARDDRLQPTDRTLGSDGRSAGSAIRSMCVWDSASMRLVSERFECVGVILWFRSNLELAGQGSRSQQPDEPFSFDFVTNRRYAFPKVRNDYWALLSFACAKLYLALCVKSVACPFLWCHGLERSHRRPPPSPTTTKRTEGRRPHLVRCLAFILGTARARAATQTFCRLPSCLWNNIIHHTHHPPPLFSPRGTHSECSIGPLF